MIRITDIKLELSDALNASMELDNLKKYVITNYRMKDRDILSMSIYKKAIDARKKDHVHFVYSVDLEVQNGQFLLDKGIKGLSEAPILEYQEVESELFKTAFYFLIF